MRDSEKAIRMAIIASRSRGVLNLSGKGLQEVPQSAWDASVALEDDETKWWEAVKLRSVNVSQNQLSAIPEGIGQLDELQVLDASRNALRTLPQALGRLPELKVINLSHNRLSMHVDVLAQAPALAKLVVSHNPLVGLPEQLGSQQPNLAELHVEHCAVQILPQGLAAASALRTLLLSSNAISSLNATVLKGLVGLTELDVSNNKLGPEISDAIGCCSNLVVLRIEANQLQALPDDLGLCTALRELEAGRNRLRTLPDTLAACTALATLSLHDNVLADLGQAVPAMTSLRLLDLKNNDLSSLPPEIGSLNSLRAMPVAGNPLKSIPRHVRDGPVAKLLEHLRNKKDEAADGGSVAATRTAADAFGGPTSEAEAATAAVRQLNLSVAAAAQAVQEGVPGARGAGTRALQLVGRGLTAVPGDIMQTAHLLHSLELKGNALKSLPDGLLVACAALTLLDLSENQLGEWPLPDDQGALHKLRCLRLEGNPKMPPPPAYGFAAAADSLEELDLSGCISAASKLGVLQECNKLHTLHLARCSLSDVPAAALALPSLKTLGLGTNAIAELPLELTKLTALEVLDVRNNNLKQLLPQLGLLPLKSLMVEGNILRTMRRSVLERGTAALLEYLRDRIPPG